MPKIFDLSLKLNGYPIDAARQRLNEIIDVPENEYAAFIEDRKRDIVAYHLANNPFYRALHLTDQFDSWEAVPVMQKADFQQPLAERLSKGFTAANVYVNKTSGSSGNPFVFAKDKFCHALIWANIMRRFAWYGIDFNYSCQARFYGMPLDFRANKMLRLKDFFANRYRFNIFDLSDKGLSEITSRFRKKKFDYINGYTSSIVMLAKYLRTNNTILKDICPTLKVCIVTSEMLFDEDKKLLEMQFNVPVVNEYGASELDVIAFQDLNDDWLVNAETLFVEILDENNMPVPNGQQGKIVVTSLYNFAHPMIRYDVGDYGVLDEKSTAKKPLLKKLVGRTNDFAVLPSGKKPAGMTFYSITKKLFDGDGNVKEFVIKQTKLDTFEIDYTSERPLTDNEIEKMKQVFSTFLEPGLTYVVNRRDKLDRGTTGKLKQFISLIKQ